MRAVGRSALTIAARRTRVVGLALGAALVASCGELPSVDELVGGPTDTEPAAISSSAADTTTSLPSGDPSAATGQVASPGTLVVEADDQANSGDGSGAEPDVDSGSDAVPPSTAQANTAAEGETTDSAAGPSGLNATEQWRRDLADSGLELPGGGTEVFPGRRLVANYGSPATFRLGVLGERSVEANIAELRQLAVEYQEAFGDGADSPPVVPSLEIIASVATVDATGDDDYSKYLPLYQTRRWVEAATEQGAFVILDLQPGRTDFVTQAKRYEEFLRLPNVGLALDG